MILIKFNEAKRIKFDVNVSGFDIKDIRGSMKLILENVEYGFPIKIMDNTIAVEIPPLNDIMKYKLVDGQSIKAQLDIIAGDTYLVPWKDMAKIDIPVTVEASMSEIKDIMESIRPTINIEAIEEEVKEIKEKKVERIEEKVKPTKNKSKFSKAMEK